MIKKIKEKFVGSKTVKIVIISMVAGFVLLATLITVVILVVDKGKNTSEVAADEEVIAETQVELVTVAQTESETQQETLTDNNSEDEVEEYVVSEEISDYVAVTDYTTSKYLDYDNEGPVFLSGSSIEVICGTTFNLDEYVSYGDYYDPSPNLSYSGYVDTNTIGTYNIVAKATDASNNSTYMDVTVNVVAVKAVSGDARTRISYKDFISTYNDGNVHFGIDVSRWQGTIDFDAVKAEGCEFVIIRIGGWDGDELYTDSCYAYNIKAAKAAGLKVGVYFHSNDNTVEGMITHTRQLLELLDGIELDFPVAFDWESWSCYQKYNMSFYTLNQLFYTFHDVLEEGGYTSMLYSSKYYLENFWDNVYNYPVWLANYVTTTFYTGSYVMWQVNNIGLISGVSSDVDLDLYYGDWN